MSFINRIWSNQPMVLIVMTIDSEASFVHGTWILSSWMWPLEKVKGECSSASSTSNLKSKLWNTASPPQRETCKHMNSKTGKITYYDKVDTNLWILWLDIFDVLVHIAQNERCDIWFYFKHCQKQANPSESCVCDFDHASTPVAIYLFISKQLRLTRYIINRSLGRENDGWEMKNSKKNWW